MQRVLSLIYQNHPDGMEGRRSARRMGDAPIQKSGSQRREKVIHLFIHSFQSLSLSVEDPGSSPFTSEKARELVGIKRDEGEERAATHQRSNLPHRVQQAQAAGAG